MTFTGKPGTWVCERMLDVLKFYVWFCRSLMGCLFSILLLWISIECAYCVAMMLICLNVWRICVLGSLSFVSNSVIEGMCVVALAPDASTISGATFHPLALMVSMSG